MAFEAKIQGLREKGLLSEGASVDLRGDGEFERNTAHWSDYRAPDPGAVVNVVTEEDVARTVSLFGFSLSTCSIPPYLRFEKYLRSA
jgi:N-acyl-D-aspartate/D-glutamate deacylase